MDEWGLLRRKISIGGSMTRSNFKYNNSKIISYTGGFMKKNYSFQFMLTDRTIQQRIIDFISPINNRMEILNLQLAYGIVETQNNLFLTRIKTVDRTDRNTGQPYYTTRFVVLTKDESFAASYTSDNLSDAGIFFLRL